MFWYVSMQQHPKVFCCWTFWMMRNQTTEDSDADRVVLSRGPACHDIEDTLSPLQPGEKSAGAVFVDSSCVSLPFYPMSWIDCQLINIENEEQSLQLAFPRLTTSPCFTTFCMMRRSWGPTFLWIARLNSGFPCSHTYAPNVEHPANAPRKAWVSSTANHPTNGRWSKPKNQKQPAKEKHKH